MEEILDEGIRNGQHHDEPQSCFLRGLYRAVVSAAFLFPLLTFTILLHVALRYVCGINFVWLEELHWQLYAYLASFGVVFSFITNDHVESFPLGVFFVRKCEGGSLSSVKLLPLTV